MSSPDDGEAPFGFWRKMQDDDLKNLYCVARLTFQASITAFACRGRSESCLRSPVVSRLVVESFSHPERNRGWTIWDAFWCQVWPSTFTYKVTNTKCFLAIVKSKNANCAKSFYLIWKFKRMNISILLYLTWRKGPADGHRPCVVPKCCSALQTPSAETARPMGRCCWHLPLCTPCTGVLSRPLDILEWRPRPKSWVHQWLT